MKRPAPPLLLVAPAPQLKHSSKMSSMPSPLATSPRSSPNGAVPSSQQPPQQPENTVEFKCKGIIFFRWLYAVLFNVAMQFLLLALFLLFVNFSVWHPINWVTQTIRLILSIYTWLRITPLICVVVVYGMYLGKSYMNEQKMFLTRFMVIYKTTMPTIVFYLLHFLIGFLTTWLYSNFLSADYQTFFTNRSECETDTYQYGFNVMCVNEKFLFIALTGSLSALLYCWHKNPAHQQCEFPIIHQSSYLRIRTQLYSVLWTTLLKSFVPILIVHITYSLIGRYPFEWLMKSLLTKDFVLNGNVHIYDIKLFLVTWILTTHILSNLYLMAHLIHVFLTQPQIFPIESGSLGEGFVYSRDQNQVSELTLVQALGNSKVAIVRQLAALDLYKLSVYGDIYQRRKQIFALSIPGGHPYNWNELSNQCISSINAFHADLSKGIRSLNREGLSMKATTYGISNHAMKMAQPQFGVQDVPEFRSSTPTSATELAEKIRNRQYNQSCGIRNMLSTNNENDVRLLSPIKQVADPCARFNQTVGFLQQKIASVKQAVMNITAIRYLFGANEMAHIQALLALPKVDEISWIVQGISMISVHSLNEDRYGVVQINLPEIISTLLQLRETLNHLPVGFVANAVSPYQRGSQSKPNGAIVLKNAVKRSLYNICITFNDYLPDLVRNSSDLRILQNYVEFSEN